MRLDSELHRLRALAEVSRRLYENLELDPLLDNILAAALESVHAERGTVFVCDPARREIWSRVMSGIAVGKQAGKAAGEPAGDRLEIRLPYGQGMAGVTAASGERLWVDDVADCASFDPETDKRTGFTTKNALCIPVRGPEGDCAGVLQLLNRPGGFSADDVEFLELMAGHVGQALRTAMAQQFADDRRRLERELKLAAEIQQALLPVRLPRWSGLQLAARNLPCEAIGGDYYDAMEASGGRRLVLLADVSGKGIPAALVMSNVQAALQAAAMIDFDLAGQLGRLNDQLHGRLGGKRYLTGIFALLESAAPTGILVNAGHPDPLIAGPSGVRRVTGRDMPLALLPGRRFTTHPFALAPGEMLLLYSDGLTDAPDQAGEPLGIAGVEKLFAAAYSDDPVRTLDKIFTAFKAHETAASDRDDQTALIIRAE